MKIAYLHGLESNNLGPKNEWLKTISDLYNPLIDYKEKGVYRRLKSEIFEFKPNFIIGSSMGGYFAYNIAKELNIKAILFNPALHSRSYEPDMTGFEVGIHNPSIYFVLGKNDTLIEPKKTVSLIESQNYDLLFFEHGHDTPYQLFKSVIINIIAEDSK